MKLEICDEFFYRFDGENLLTRFNTCKNNILRNNPNLNFYCGEWVKIKINNFKTHCVKPMETLAIIAKLYNIDVNKIIHDNNLKSNKLFIGQTLKIFIK